MRSQKNVNGPKTAIDAVMGRQWLAMLEIARATVLMIYTGDNCWEKEPCDEAKLVRAATRARHSDLSQIMIVVASVMKALKEQNVRTSRLSTASLIMI